MLEKFKVLANSNVHLILEALKVESYTEQELFQKTLISELEFIKCLEILEKSNLIIKKTIGDIIKFTINDDELIKASNVLISYCNNSKNDNPIINKPYRLDTYHSLSYHFFNNRESGFKHGSFEREISFYESVREGNLEVVKNLITPLGGEGFGVLSYDQLRNIKYHLVVTIAMVTRFCINGGMPPEEAYNLSDIYILKTDDCRNQDELEQVHSDVVIDFTKRMRNINKNMICSKPVSICLDYISDNLHEKILLKDIADHLNLSVPYLSKLFKSEMGIALSEYIIIKKIEAASNMLQFSDYSSIEISNYFSFSSHSYFIKLFKKYMSMTPKEYKDKYFSVAWMKKELSDKY